MKTDVASTFPPLAGHPPKDGWQPAIPAPPDALESMVSREPPAAAGPVASEAIAPRHLESLDLRRDLMLFARVLRGTDGGRRVVAIFLGSIAINVANMVGQVRLNAWNGQFFDAIGKKDLSAFVHHLWTFLAIIAALLTLTVAQTFLQESLKYRLREWISRHLLAEWLKPMRAYQMSFAGRYGRNPDQRIQEDTRLLGDYSADLGCGIVYSLLQIIAFVGVLWGLSAQVTFQVVGHEVAIPGYMVWCALAYASIGSSLTWLVGRPLIALNGERYAREAEFRFALVRANESAESIALIGGEKDEYRHLDVALTALVNVMRRISYSLARLTWITSGTGWLALVVPILVAAPAYFGGRLTLGGLVMVAGAFSQVQGAMRWFVDNFSRLADWRATVHRVARFREKLDSLPAIREGAEEIRRERHPDGQLTFEHVRILLPDGHELVEDATFKVMPGERVLIVGDSGIGEATLFRAVAGLWPWGAGTILTPAPEAMAFLPQRPYLPLGTLRNALSYPAPTDAFSDLGVQDALRRCGLGHLIVKLDQTERWDRQLSLGEQECLAFARVLLHKPSWIFLDEATAALDEERQRDIMSLFDAELKNSTVLSIGHRPDLAAYHDRTLKLMHGRMSEASVPH